MKSHKLVILSKLSVEESKEKELLFDITEKPVEKKDKGKIKRTDNDEQKRIEKKSKKKKKDKDEGCFKEVRCEGQVV